MADKNVMNIDSTSVTDQNAYYVNMNAQLNGGEIHQFQNSQTTMDFNSYMDQQKNDLLRSLAQNSNMLNDFTQFLQFIQNRSLQQASLAVFNGTVFQNQYPAPLFPNLEANVHYQSSTPKRSRPLNESNGSISSAPKQHKAKDNKLNNINLTKNPTTSNQQERTPISFDQLKRAVTSNLPCFFIEFDRKTSSQQLPSAFEARNTIEQFFNDHSVTVQQSLVGWSGKRLKLGENNKEDYMTLVTTENWPTLIKNIPITVIKPKFVPDCFALVVRYVPIAFDIETVRDEIKRTITSADNVKQINYLYARKTNDFRFTVTDLTEYNTALQLGRISMGNHWLSITQFLAGNRMTYCTKCWKLGHLRDQCKTNRQRRRVCLQDITRKDEHSCTNIAKCAQCDIEHHSLHSQCPVTRQCRADLKDDVKKAIEAGKLQRNANHKCLDFNNKNQEFPPLNEANKPQQQQLNAWNRTQLEARRKEEIDSTKILTIINENIIAMRENNNRMEERLERIEAKVNQAVLDSDLHQSTIDNVIENVQLMIEQILWPLTAQLKSELLRSQKGLQPILNNLGKIRSSLRDDYETRRKRAVTPPIQENASTSKGKNNCASSTTNK